MVALFYLLPAYFLALVGSSNGQENATLERQLFDAFYKDMDCNGDQAISKDDVMCKLRDAGSASKFFESADTNNDGSISNTEFRKFFADMDTNSYLNATSCQDRFEPHHGSCYYFSTDEKTWDAAYDSCKQLGAMLVEINTADENEYISARCCKLGNYWWIGLTDKVTEGEYVWETSKAILSGDSVSMWGVGQPGGGTHQNCVCYAPSHDYQWGDAKCTRKEHYICEKSGEERMPIG